MRVPELAFLLLIGGIDAQVALNFDGKTALHKVDSRYVCFNIDTGSLYNGLNFSDVKLRTLVQQLTLGDAGSIIRIGGTAVDSSFYFPSAPYNVGAPNQCGGSCPRGSSDIGNAMLDAAFEFAISTGMSLLWDVNGESFRDGSGPWQPSGNASAMLAYLDSVYAGKINYAYSVGNEPDLWKIQSSAATLGGDAVTMKQTLASLNIGHEVYGSSFARISPQDAQGFMPVAAEGGVNGYTVHSYPYGGHNCNVTAYLDKTRVTIGLANSLKAVAQVKDSIPAAAEMLLVLEETAGSSGGGCDNVTDRFLAGFCWINTLMTVGRSGFDRVHRQDIVGWSFAFGMSHYQLVGPPGWTVGSDLLTPHPDYFTTILWRQIVGLEVLNTSVSGDSPALLDSFEAGFWCSSAQSPYGKGSVVLAYSLQGEVPVQLALPASISNVPYTSFILSATANGTGVSNLVQDTIFLNGEQMTVGTDGSLPAYPISGSTIAAGVPVILPPLTYGFIVFNSGIQQACS